MIRRRRVRHEVDREVEFHIQERIDALLERGWTRAAAESEARRLFGDSASTRDELTSVATHRERRLDVVESIANVRQDLRVALRQLRRSPAFALGSVAAFALGIGANATMFGVLDRLLLRPPAHVRDAENVYLLRVPTRAHAPAGTTSYPLFASMRDALAPIAPLSMQTYPNPVAVAQGENGSMAPGVFVDGGYFRTLGVQAARGRLFVDDDTRMPDGEPVVVIGYRLWQTRFGGNDSVIGREIRVGTDRVRIVGVAPDGFNGVGLKPIDVWMPVTKAASLFVSSSWATDANFSWLFTFTRIPLGSSPEQIAARATTGFLALTDRGASGTLTNGVELHSILPSRATKLSPEAKVASMLGAVSVLVLLIACSNVANLMLARAVQRRRELGVRLALGGTALRVASQLITDSLVLAAFGGLAAIAVAALGNALMRGILLAGYAWNGPLVDGRTLAFIASAAVVAGMLSGCVPALFLRRFDLRDAIAEGRQSGGVHRQRTISSLVVAQTVLSVILLVGAALFVRSLRAVHGVPLGVDAEHTVVISLDTKAEKFDAPATDELFARVAERVRRVPDAQRVAIAEAIPFDADVGTGIDVPGFDRANPLIKRGANLSAVTADYFSAIGTRIVEGRDFAAADDRDDGDRVAIISATLAHGLWPNSTALGQCVRLGVKDSLPCRRIIGVAENTHTSAIVEDGAPTPDVFVPLSQGHQRIDARVIVVRTIHPAASIPMLRNAVREAAPSLPFPEIWPMMSRLDPELRPWRLGAIMFGAFGGLSLVLAMLGLFSVVAYSIAQRRQEMGIRVALGARPSQIIGLISREGVRLVAIGAAMGLAASMGLAPLIQPLLFGASARSIATYLTVAAGMLAVALLACVIPALGAARTNPMVAIRAD